MARRKEIYETLHPTTKPGVAQALGMNKALGNNVSEIISPTFVDDTASKIGVSDRTVELSIKRAKTFTDDQGEVLKRAEIKQTDATKLARLEEPQREAVIKVIAFVVSLNLSRRHLNSSQKAMIALDVEQQLAKEAKQRQSESGKVYGRGIETKKVVQNFEQPMESRSSEKAAKITKTNRQYVVEAKKIAAQAPELKEAVLSGTLNIPDAKAVAKLPEPQRAAVMELLLLWEPYPEPRCNLTAGIPQLEDRTVAMGAMP